jgi:hypothetical protein
MDIYTSNEARQTWAKIDEILYPPAGTMDDRYQIYLDCIEGTGQPVKTYDEWLGS